MRAYVYDELVTLSQFYFHFGTKPTQRDIERSLYQPYIVFLFIQINVNNCDKNKTNKKRNKSKSPKLSKVI